MRSEKNILDTNLWISLLITRKLDNIDNVIENKKIKLIFSNELIEEFLTVVKIPKFEKYLPPIRQKQQKMETSDR